MAEDSQETSGQKPEIRAIPEEVVIEGGTYRDASPVEKAGGIAGVFVTEDKIDDLEDPKKPIIIRDIWTIPSEKRGFVSGKRYWVNLDGSLSNKVDSWAQGQGIHENGFFPRIEKGSGENNDKLTFTSIEFVKS